MRFAHITNFVEKYNKNSFGLAAAGEWIKKNADDRTLIVATATREIRYYSGINFQEFGGHIVTYPRDKAAMRKLIADHKGKIILEVSVWGLGGDLYDKFLAEDFWSLKDDGFNISEAVCITESDQKKPRVVLITRPAQGE
jgi:cephalosporin hydroxylase